MGAKHILIVYAGGTIGMMRAPAGLVPNPDFKTVLQQWISGEALAAPHQFTLVAQDPLIDSAEATPTSWFAIARQIFENRQGIDGVIVLHGTDTMAYTASALSFLLLGFAKPIILTGAQVPFFQTGSDAQANLRAALMTALDGCIRETCIVFDGVVLRGNRSRKNGTEIGDSFVSPNYPVLGYVGEKLTVEQSQSLDWQRPEARPVPRYERDRSVGLIKIFPGISEHIVLSTADAHPHGLILELYGSGTGPTLHQPLRAALESTIKSGTPIVAISQTLRGAVRNPAYASGRVLTDMGILPGHDLTPEAALTKLTYLVNQDSTFSSKDMIRPLAGEMSISESA